jgi:hypothetical protein
MLRDPVLRWLGAALLAACCALWLWQSPGLVHAPLSSGEVARYIAAIDAQLPVDAASKPAMLDRLRAWAEADDGRPVTMLNLMRYREHTGESEQSNAYYEREVLPLLAQRGGYPAFAGESAGRNLVGEDPALDDWSRVLLVRYPNRRAFLDLLSDPDYAPLLPYKLQALDLWLVPLRSELAIPDLRLAGVAFALIVLLAVGWIRASQRSATRR